MLQEKALLHMNSTNKVSFSFILQYLFNSFHRTLFHCIEFIKFYPRILEKTFFELKEWNNLKVQWDIFRRMMLVHTILQSFDAVKLIASIISTLQQLLNFLGMLARQQLFMKWAHSSLLFNPCEWPRLNFSTQNQYRINQKSNQNKAKANSLN